MDRIKKMSSKVFKKSQTQPPPYNHPAYVAPKPTFRDRLKRSPSMPMQSSGGTNDTRTRPLYRGVHPLKPSDIQLVVDTSTEPSNGRRIKKDGRVHDPYYGDDLSDDEDAPTHRSPVIPHHMLEKFPSPPDINAYTTPRVPPNPGTYSRPPAANAPYPTDADILNLPPHPYFERLRREQEHHRQLSQRNHPTRQPTVQRSSSTASYSRPTPLAYPTLSNSNSNSSPPPSYAHRSRAHHPGGSIQTYHTSHSNLSMHNLGPHARLMDGPTAHRPVIRQASTPAIRHPVPAPAPVQPVPSLGPYHPDVRRAVCGPEKVQRMRLCSTPAQHLSAQKSGYDGYNAFQDSQYSKTGPGTRAAAIHRKRCGHHY